MTGGQGNRDQSEKRLELFLKRLIQRLLALLSKVGRSTPEPIVQHSSLRRIIVIRQHNQFGDVLCTVPLLRSLNMKFHPVELTVVVSPQNIDALAGCPYVTKLLNYDKLAFYRKPRLFLNFIRELRKGYDILLVPSNVSLSLTNDVMAFFVKARHKFGPASLESTSNRTGSVYNVAVRLDWGSAPVHQAFRNMKVAAPLGLGKETDSGELEYEVAEPLLLEAQEFVGKLAQRGSSRIAIHPGAGKRPNRWGVSNFAALANQLFSELNADIFITEGPMDHEVIDSLTSIISSPFIRVRNKAVSFIAALLKQMDLVISNDTGIMHLAAAVGTPTLSLFGPTDPLQWAPLGNRHRFILGRGGDIDTVGAEKTYLLARKLLQIK